MGRADSFIDEIAIEVLSGAGGRGSSSFRREKYVPNGGPDGGDGGSGGDVAIVANAKLTSLSHLRDRRRWQAEKGGDGGKSKRSGRDGERLVVPVPVGTVVVDQETGQQLADLDHSGASVVVAVGGRGGRGNMHFRSSVRQAPRAAELGAPGQSRRLQLELRLIADIGLVGRPNAGKSTLLAALTHAHPKIADYPFTTLSPNLGVLELDRGQAAVVADVPGLIEGAHQGAGLGLAFLRHLRRTRLLVHVIDGAETEAEIDLDVAMIAQELRSYAAGLEGAVALRVLNKMDLIQDRSAISAVAERMSQGCPTVMVSALTHEGLAELSGLLGRLVALKVPASEPSPVKVVRIMPRQSLSEFSVSVEGEGHGQVMVVAGQAVERLVAMTDLENEEAVARLQRSLRRAGVDEALRRAGAVPGMTVRVGSVEFSFEE